MLRFLLEVIADCTKQLDSCGLSQQIMAATSYVIPAGFPAKYAVALSNFTIVGGAVANLFFNINRRHSFKPKPLIDWDLILVMEPSTILGAVIGGYLNKVTCTLCLRVSHVCLWLG